MEETIQITSQKAEVELPLQANGFGLSGPRLPGSCSGGRREERRHVTRNRKDDRDGGPKGSDQTKSTFELFGFGEAQQSVAVVCSSRLNR